MRTLHLVIIFTITSIGLNAQPNWHQVNSGVQDQVSSIIFQDSLIGYATAGNKILKSTDAGENWTLYYQDTNLWAFSGLAIYKDSLFVTRIDTGSASWNRIYALHLFQIATKGNRIIQTTESLLSYLGLISFGDKVWIQGDGKTLEYKDGRLTILQSEFQAFNVYDSVVIGVGFDKVYITLDEGLSWDTITHPPITLNGAGGYYQGGDTIVVYSSGFPSSYYISYDKGLNFYSRNINSLTRPVFINSQKMFGVINYGSNGIVSKSINGGMSYTKDTLSFNSKFIGVYLYSNRMLFVFGDNGVIFKSTNLGGLVGLNEKNEVNLGEIKIYPNPTNDFLRIDWKDQSKYKVSQLKVVNTMGKELQVINGFKSQIDLNGYPKGVYFLQIVSEKGVASKSFVVK